MVGVERGNMENMEERGEHEHHRVVSGRFEVRVGEDGVRMIEFDVEVVIRPLMVDGGARFEFPGEVVAGARQGLV